MYVDRQNRALVCSLILAQLGRRKINNHIFTTHPKHILLFFFSLDSGYYVAPVLMSAELEVPDALPCAGSLLVQSVLKLLSSD